MCATGTVLGSGITNKHKSVLPPGVYKSVHKQVRGSVLDSRQVSCTWQRGAEGVQCLGVLVLHRKEKVDARVLWISTLECSRRCSLRTLKWEPRSILGQASLESGII